MQPVQWPVLTEEMDEAWLCPHCRIHIARFLTVLETGFLSIGGSVHMYLQPSGLCEYDKYIWFLARPTPCNVV